MCFGAILTPCKTWQVCSFFPNLREDSIDNSIISLCWEVCYWFCVPEHGVFFCCPFSYFSVNIGLNIWIFLFSFFIAYVKSGKILSCSCSSVVRIYYLELRFLCWKVSMFCCCPKLKGDVAECPSAVVKLTLKYCLWKVTSPMFQLVVLFLHSVCLHSSLLWWYLPCLK